jgi:hypothetical protein
MLPEEVTGDFSAIDLSCGTALRGRQTDRLDALNLLYPGDDVVDLVGCDFFDWYATLRSTKQAGRDQSSPRTLSEFKMSRILRARTVRA